MTASHTLDQQRAKFAWDKVQKISKEYFAGDFKTLSKAAPALIMGNGLMQALAFYQSRKPEEPKRLVKMLFEWLASRGIGGVKVSEFEEGMQALQKCSSADYLRATDEALEILRWIRQFADAVIGALEPAAAQRSSSVGRTP